MTLVREVILFYFIQVVIYHHKIERTTLTLKIMEEITLNAEKPIEIYIQNHSYCVVYHAIQMSSGLTIMVLF